MKQTPNDNKATMNNKATAKQTKKQGRQANAHRRTNKRWEPVRHLIAIARQLPESSPM